MNHRFLILVAASLAFSASLFAQGERKDKTAVTYEELYDEPSSVNKLFVGIQPLFSAARRKSDRLPGAEPAYRFAWR